MQRQWLLRLAAAGAPGRRRAGGIAAADAASSARAPRAPATTATTLMPQAPWSSSPPPPAARAFASAPSSPLYAPAQPAVATNNNSNNNSSTNGNGGDPGSASASAADLIQTTGPPPSEGPALYYRRRLDEGAWRPDPRQAVTVRLLQELYEGLREIYPKPPRRSGLTMMEHVESAKSKQSWFSGITAMLHARSGLQAAPSSSAAADNAASGPRVPRGLYMYGGVGCGKTMLMDSFAESCPREFQVRRAHYHDFMLDVHGRLRQYKGERDPLARVADALASSCRVLCLDELFVTDVADAMILGRLFGRLWDDGLVLVATSNRAPSSLYEGGLQRQLFLPFIERLQRRCHVHDMASGVDYRRLAHHARGTYFVAPDRDAALADAFARAAVEEERAAGEAAARVAAGGGKALSASSSSDPPAAGAPAPIDIPVAMGRLLHVPRAAGRACLFDFQELCGRPVAAADYLALAERFDAVALRNVPVFTGANVATGHRFVTLVDILYENRTRLLVSAEAPPFALFENVVTRLEAQERAKAAAGGGGAAAAADADSRLVVDEQLGFAKDRAISRLTEMQTAEYAAAHLEVLARRARGEPAVPHKDALTQ